METFLLYASMASTLIFFLKWRMASVGKPGSSAAEDVAARRLEDLSASLRRIEGKVDKLSQPPSQIAVATATATVVRILCQRRDGKGPASCRTVAGSRTAAFRVIRDIRAIHIDRVIRH